MFTGIIEEIGVVKSLVRFGAGLRIQVQADKVFSDLKIDDSVALNGTCQTVVAINGKSFEVEAVEETLQKTTLSKFKISQRINLERALLPTTRMGGHIVQGHIDCVGTISRINKLSASTQIFVKYPEKYNKYAVTQGSITIDGTSLTIARISPQEFMLSLIPHTMTNTIIDDYRVGQSVNIEFDVLGKYIENLLKYSDSKASSDKSILEQFIDQPY